MSAAKTAAAFGRDAGATSDHDADPIESLRRQIERVAIAARQVDDVKRKASLLALNTTISAARSGDPAEIAARVAADVKAFAAMSSAASSEITEVVTALIHDFDRLATRIAGAGTRPPQRNSAQVLSLVRPAEPEPEPEPVVTEAQKALVQETFARLKPAAEQAAHLFYARLFQIAPQVRATFPDDMAGQRHRLLATLEGAVAGLDDLEKLAPSDVEDEEDGHSDAVGAALLWTLDKALGPEFTSEVEDAWVAVYRVLSKVLKLASA
ncbi:MAG: globin domain-containing protein [Hyphomicrobiales bacterium]